MRTPCKQPSDRLSCDEDIGRKLAVAELEVFHLNEIFKQVTQKYTEDIRKLEEKVQQITKTEFTIIYELKMVSRASIPSTNDHRNKNIGHFYHLKDKLFSIVM